MADAYYAVVRQLSYTWEQLLREKCTRTFYMIEKLEEEAEKAEEDMPDEKPGKKSLN